MSLKPQGSSPGSGAKKIALATMLMMLGNIIGKISGLLRAFLIKEKIGGLGSLSDSITLGLQIPDLFYQLLIGGAIQAAITPALSSAIERKREKDAWKSVSIFISVMSLILLVFVALGILFSDRLFPILYRDAYSSNPEKVMLAASISRILYPQVFFMMLAALCIGILNAYKSFSSTAFGPTIYNLCVALFIFFLGSPDSSGVYNVAWGITFSALIYFLFQFSVGFKRMRNFRVSLDIHDEGFRYIFARAFPTMLSGAAIQINTILLSDLAGGFGDGVATAMNNAVQIWQLPYGIFAVSVGVVMIPSLSSFYGKRNYTGYRQLLSKSLRNALFLTIPFAFVFFLLREDVSQAIFLWRLSENELHMVSTLLLGYCPAIVTATMVYLYNQSFFSRGKAGIPLINAGISLVSTFVISNLYARLGMGMLSVSVGYSTASLLGVVFLSIMMHRDKKVKPPPLAAFFMRIFLCLFGLILSITALHMLPIHPSGMLMSYIWLGIKVGIGLVMYLLTAYLLNMREVKAVLRRRK